MYYQKQKLLTYMIMRVMKMFIQQFIDTFDLFKATSKLGKQIKYNLGYSNFTFDLWMVLHKSNCNTSIAPRRQYLTTINRAYDENFQSLDQYKHENNFFTTLSVVRNLIPQKNRTHLWYGSPFIILNPR